MTAHPHIVLKTLKRESNNQLYDGLYTWCFLVLQKEFYCKDQFYPI